MSDVTNTFYPAEGSAHGYGSQLLVGFASGSPGSPEIFEAIAEVRVITFGEMNTAIYDRTHLRSKNACREKAAALLDTGPFTLECNWRPRHESQSFTGGGSGSFTGGGMMRKWIERKELNYKLVKTEGEDEPLEIPFAGVCTKFQPGPIGADDGPNLTIDITPLNGVHLSSFP